MIAVPVRKPETDPAPDRKCEVHYCNRDIPSKHFMCPDHWRLVPERLRGEIAGAQARRDGRKLQGLIKRAAGQVRAIEGREF